MAGKKIQPLVAFVCVNHNSLDKSAKNIKLNRGTADGIGIAADLFSDYPKGAQLHAEPCKEKVKP